MSRKVILALLLVVGLMSCVYAMDKNDSVALKNGSFIKGTIKDLTIGGNVKIETADGNIFVFEMQEITAITAYADSVFMRNGNRLVHRIVEITPGGNLKCELPDGSTFVFDTADVDRIVFPSEEAAYIEQTEEETPAVADEPAEDTQEEAVKTVSKPAAVTPAPVKKTRQRTIPTPPPAYKKSNMSLLVFGGGVFGMQMVDEIIEDSEIGSGMGFNGGIGIQLSQLWITASYAMAQHTYSIKTEDVGLNFTDIMFNVGFDFVKGKKVTPFVHGMFGLANMKDKESEGFTGGTSFGFGAGVKMYFSDMIFLSLSGVFGLNTYSEFEVTDVDAFNQEKVGGNYLLILANVGVSLDM